MRAGHEVTVITCAPNHPNGIIYPGYKNKWWQWDEKDGVRVLRVKTYLSANKGVANRSLNYFSYLLSAAAFCRLVKNVDLVVSTSPQFFCGLSGYFVSRLHGCPWVVEIRDLWPESIHAVGAVSGRGLIGFLERIELFLYQKPHHIVALTPAFKRHMVKKGIAPEKVSIVTNGADLEQFNPLPKENGFREQHQPKRQVHRFLRGHSRHGACPGDGAARPPSCSKKNHAFSSCWWETGPSARIC